MKNMNKVNVKITSRKLMTIDNVPFAFIIRTDGEIGADESFNYAIDHRNNVYVYDDDLDIFVQDTSAFAHDLKGRLKYNPKEAITEDTIDEETALLCWDELDGMLDDDEDEED